MNMRRRIIQHGREGSPTPEESADFNQIGRAPGNSCRKTVETVEPIEAKGSLFHSRKQTAPISMGQITDTLHRPYGAKCQASVRIS